MHSAAYQNHLADTQIWRNNLQAGALFVRPLRQIKLYIWCTITKHSLRLWKPKIKGCKLSFMLCIWRTDWRFERSSLFCSTMKVFLKIWVTLLLYGQFITSRHLAGITAKHVSALYIWFWSEEFANWTRRCCCWQTISAIIYNHYLNIPAKNKSKCMMEEREQVVQFYTKLRVLLKLVCKYLMLESCLH